MVLTLVILGFLIAVGSILTAVFQAMFREHVGAGVKVTISVACILIVVGITGSLLGMFLGSKNLQDAISLPTTKVYLAGGSIEVRHAKKIWNSCDNLKAAGSHPVPPAMTMNIVAQDQSWDLLVEHDSISSDIMWLTEDGNPICWIHLDQLGESEATLRS